MSVEKVFKKMQAEQAYVALKLGKLKAFISSESFDKFLSPEMQEIKKTTSCSYGSLCRCFKQSRYANVY